ALLHFRPSVAVFQTKILRNFRMVPISSLAGIDSRSLKNGDAAPKELQAGHFRLYSMRFCPFSKRALIYLAKKGIKAEIININLKEKPEWYFAKNSDGAVPTLEYDGKVVSESTVISQFLDDLMPETSILPKDPYERAQQRILFGKLSPVR
uniref:Glutathione S-transferase omega n=1 Tax=Parascaris univalens TaxID=6257 RepID=A0A915APK8_PARUN